MVSGAKIAPRRGRAGVRWVRALTDLPTVLGEVRAGRLSPRAYLESLRPPIEWAVLAADDPVPALVELPAALTMAWRRRKIEGPACRSPLAGALASKACRE